MRALEKPQLAAWAVNQLYWRKPSVFKRVIAVAEARRKAHGRKLSGKDSDVDAAEAAHAAAVRAGADEIRALLSADNDAPTPTTMSAVIETLQALPGDTPPGRLTRPLKLSGFEALAGLLPTGERTLRALAPPPKPEPAPVREKRDESGPRAARREAEAKKTEDAARRQRVDETRKALREATAEAKAAATALTAARQTLTRAKADRDRLQDQLQFAVKALDDASTAARAREAESTLAAHEQARLENLLKTTIDSR